MAKISLIIALIGGFVLIFTNWAILLELLALILAIIAFAADKKKKTAVYAFFLSLFYILAPVWTYLKTSNIDPQIPEWMYLPSAADYYFGPTYDQKKNNFSFDSLMLDDQQLNNLQLSSEDTMVGPDDAPLD